MTIEQISTSGIVFEKRYGITKQAFIAPNGNITIARDNKCPIIFDDDEANELINWMHAMLKL